jgi:hypothetical protein
MGWDLFRFLGLGFICFCFACFYPHMPHPTTIHTCHIPHLRTTDHRKPKPTSTQHNQLCVVWWLFKKIKTQNGQNTEWSKYRKSRKRSKVESIFLYRYILFCRSMLLDELLNPKRLILAKLKSSFGKVVVSLAFEWIVNQFGRWTTCRKNKRHWRIRMERIVGRRAQSIRASAIHCPLSPSIIKAIQITLNCMLSNFIITLAHFYLEVYSNEFR